MTATEISRRTLLKTAAFGVAGATLSVGAAGRAFAAKELTVGVVYVGARDDFGWNQAHAVAIKALKGVPGVKVVEEENVPETDAVSKSMESMINLDGAGLILATSFGYYKPFVLDLAKKYPDVEFRHAAPLWNKDTDPKNAGSYFGYLNQAHYVDGVAAGLSTKTNKLGFVAAKPIASVLEQHQFVHARRAIGQSESDRAGDLHRRLVDARPRSGVRQRARRRWLRRHHLPRRRTEGGHRDGGEARGQKLRPQREPGAARAEGLHHRRRIQVDHDLQGLRHGPRGRARRCPTSWRADTKPTTSRTPRSAPARRPEGQKAALAAIEGLKARKPIYVGPLKDNKTGKVVIDKTYDNLDPFLDKMDYLLEGVVGSTT